MGFVHDRVKRYRTIATRKNARDRPVEVVMGAQGRPKPNRHKRLADEGVTRWRIGWVLNLQTWLVFARHAVCG